MERIVLTQKEYMWRQIEEIFSSENRYFVWEKLGRSGTDMELAWHYILNGGARDFARRYVPENVIRMPKKTN